LLTPLLAIFTALVIGAIVMAAFDPEVWAAFRLGLGRGIGTAFQRIFVAYTALFEGSFGSPARIIGGISAYAQTGDDTQLLRGIRPLMESLRITTPYIFTGLAVALGFRCGLFNIGAEGQYFMGGLAAVFIGYSVKGLPWIIHLPLAIIAGIIGGAIWSGIAGYLKAQTGAHEVINTIMLNYIAFRLADFLLQVGGPMARPGDNRPVSPEILPTAYLPQFFPNSASLRTNSGIFLAIAAVFFVHWLLFKTTLGFEIRTVGANPRAALTAGINVRRNIIVAMGISGGLAGLAGVHDILGVTRYMPNAFFSGYGFDAIAIALMGKSHPVGVMLAALLFGFLRAGAQQMQGVAQVPIDIISVLQGLIIIFIAAPALVRYIYRIRDDEDSQEAIFTRGWGST
jgi:simple sugar transport system permease protein